MFDTTSTDVALDTSGTRNTTAVNGQAETSCDACFASLYLISTLHRLSRRMSALINAAIVLVGVVASASLVEDILGARRCPGGL
jgi:hypothetical protein